MTVLLLVQTLSTRFGQDFEVEVQARLLSWLVSILPLMFCRGYVESKLNLGRDSEARFGQDFEAIVLWKGWCLVEILKLMLQNSEV